MNETGWTSQVFIKTVLFNNANISVALHFYLLPWGWGSAEVQLLWLSGCPGFKLGLCLLSASYSGHWTKEALAVYVSGTTYGGGLECQVTKPHCA